MSKFIERTHTSRKPHIPLIAPTASAFHRTPLFPHNTENCFSDIHGRTIVLHGLNVGACSKVPTVITRMNSSEKQINYSGRPFKTIEEASEWWARLRLWGVSIIRWVVTWEAIEPQKM